MANAPPASPAEGPSAYCLVPFGAATVAVAVAAVEAFMEASRVVRLPLAPRPLAGLARYRGGLLPLVAAADAGDGRPGAVVVVRSGHGLLGLLLGRGETAVVEGRPRAGPGPTPPEGLVASGTLDGAGGAVPVLDLDGTWTALRRRVERGYGLVARGDGPDGSLVP